METDLLKDEAIASIRRAIIAAVDAQPGAMERLKVAGGIASSAIGSLAGVLCAIDGAAKGDTAASYTGDAIGFLREMLENDPRKDPMPQAKMWLSAAIVEDHAKEGIY